MKQYILENICFSFSYALEVKSIWSYLYISLISLITVYILFILVDCACLAIHTKFYEDLAKTLTLYLFH